MTEATTSKTKLPDELTSTTKFETANGVLIKITDIKIVNPTKKKPEVWIFFTYDDHTKMISRGQHAFGKTQTEIPAFLSFIDNLPGPKYA